MIKKLLIILFILCSNFIVHANNNGPSDDFVTITNCVVHCRNKLDYGTFWQLTSDINSVLSRQITALTNSISRRDRNAIAKSLSDLSSHEEDLRQLAIKCYTHPKLTSKSVTTPTSAPKTNSVIHITGDAGGITVTRGETTTQKSGSTWTAPSYGHVVTYTPKVIKQGETFEFKRRRSSQPDGEWNFIGEAIIDSNEDVEIPSSSGQGMSDEELGGLSGMFYNPEDGLFYMISDNSQAQKPAIYKFSLDEKDGEFKLRYAGAIRLTTDKKRCYKPVTYKNGKKEEGAQICNADKIYNTNFESIAAHPQGGFLITSEAPFGGGDVSQRIRRFDEKGVLKEDIDVDEKYQYETKWETEEYPIRPGKRGEYSTEGKPDHKYNGIYISQYPEKVGDGKDEFKRVVTEDCHYEYKDDDKKAPPRSAPMGGMSAQVLNFQSSSQLLADTKGDILPDFDSMQKQDPFNSSPPPSKRSTSPASPPARTGTRVCKTKVRYEDSKRRWHYVEGHNARNLKIRVSTNYWIRGVRENHGFEGGATTPDGRYFVATEGPMATGIMRSSRLIEYDLTGKKPKVEHEYLYVRDEGHRKGMYYEVSEIVAESNDTFLVIERYYDTQQNKPYARVYRVHIDKDKDVIKSPKYDKNKVLSKELVVDLNDVDGYFPDKTKLDNYEGISFGPKTADGRQTVMLVSDNNYGHNQRNSFLLFTLKEEKKVQAPEEEVKEEE